MLIDAWWFSSCRMTANIKQSTAPLRQDALRGQQGFNISGAQEATRDESAHESLKRSSPGSNLST